MEVFKIPPMQKAMEQEEDVSLQKLYQIANIIIFLLNPYNKARCLKILLYKHLW